MAKSTKVVLAILAVLLLITCVTTVVMVARPSARNSQEHSAPAPAVIASNKTLSTDAVVVPSDARAAKRAAMLDAIAKARSNRTAAHVGGTRTSGATPTLPTDTTLDIVDKTGDTSDWEKRALGTLNSLFGQCYDLARAEDSAFGGTIAVQFTLIGEPNVGGLLERVEILDEDTSITQQTFRDCVTQQLYALELDPPPDGVTIERQVSLKF